MKINIKIRKTEYLASDPDNAMIQAVRCCSLPQTHNNKLYNKVLRGSGWAQKQYKLHCGPETQTAKYGQSHGLAGLWIPRHNEDTRLETESGFLFEMRGESVHPYVKEESEKSLQPFHRATPSVKLWP